MYFKIVVPEMASKSNFLQSLNLPSANSILWIFDKGLTIFGFQPRMGILSSCVCFDRFKDRSIRCSVVHL